MWRVGKRRAAGGSSASTTQQIERYDPSEIFTLNKLLFVGAKKSIGVKTLSALISASVKVWEKSFPHLPTYC